MPLLNICAEFIMQNAKLDEAQAGMKIAERNINNLRKNEEMEPKQKQHPVVDVTGDGSKVRCYKEQYCIRT